MTDRQRIVQALTAMYAYYERELSDFALRIWMEDLEGFSADVVCAALTAHRRDTERGQWLPKSADVLRKINGDPAEAAQMAWERVLKVAQGGGSGKLDSASRRAVNALGGISAIQRSPVDQNGFLQKRFADAYAVYAKREREDQAQISGDVAKMLGRVGQ